MEKMKDPLYIDPTTDYGFKRIFGTEANKDLLIALLHGLFQGRKNISDLHYNKQEYVGDTEKLGTVIFDLTCTDGDGSQFIVEVQRNSHRNFKKRMLHYGCRRISDQLDEEEPKDDLEGWLYVLKNMSKMKKIPTFLSKPIFQKLFDIAEYTKLDKKEKVMYDESLKKKWDQKVIMDQLKEEGRAEGIVEGEKRGIAKIRSIIANLIKRDYDDASIVDLTESDLELVQAVRAKLSLNKKVE